MNRQNYEFQRIFQKIFQRRLPHLVQKNPRSINNKFKIFYEKRFQKIWKNAILSRDDFDYTTLIQISLKFSEQLIFLSVPVKKYYNYYLLVSKLAVFHYTVFHHNCKHKQHGENVIILNKQDVGINW